MSMKWCIWENQGHCNNNKIVGGRCIGYKECGHFVEKKSNSNSDIINYLHSELSVYEQKRENNRIEATHLDTKIDYIKQILDIFDEEENKK